jgi:hypothetical protein
MKISKSISLSLVTSNTYRKTSWKPDKKPLTEKRIMKRKWIFIGILFGATASAQMTMDMNMSSADSKFMQEMDVKMKIMDHAMASAPMNGDVDHDFVVMMIPHHQGAIDMAKGELSYGKDPVMRRLAEEIIVDQKSEIDAMNLWLKKQTTSNSTTQK